MSAETIKGVSISWGETEPPEWLPEVASEVAQRWADQIDRMTMAHLMARGYEQACVQPWCLYCDPPRFPE